jgi:hypothetical protein
MAARGGGEKRDVVAPLEGLPQRCELQVVDRFRFVG